MNEKLIFWTVVVWMVGMLALGVIAVKEVWKDAMSSANEEEAESPQQCTENNQSTQMQSNNGSQQKS